MPLQGDIHRNLQHVILSYNSLKEIRSYTFVDLKELQQINLEDNQIVNIEKQSFMNLEKLRWLYLRGNKIEVIEDEAFQNLPKLEILDMAYNKLKNFDFLSLDQVGTMSSFSLNISYCSLKVLHGNSAYMDRETVFNSNVKVLDMSHNNISDIVPGYFRPLESSLTHLYFTNNFLTNITRDSFGSLYQLQLLDLSHNLLRDIDFNTFKNIGKIQVVNLHNNVLSDIPAGLFQGVRNLRICDVSNNKLYVLPEYLFREDSLERVSLANNFLTRIPFKSFTIDAAASMRELDLSRNLISTIHSPDLFSRFKMLVYLNLSGNRLLRLEDSTFGPLQRLIHLDLSHNNQLQFEDKGRSFNGLENTLLSLNLKNVSLVKVPDLPFTTLLHLDLSGNKIKNILPDATVNLTSLRVLDIGSNDLSNIPIIILSLHNLRVLSVSSNKITTLTNTSLLNSAHRIRVIDIQYLPLETFETGALSKMVSLRKLFISTYKKIYNFNIPAILEQNMALQYLNIHVDDRSMLENEMIGKFPPKLRHVTITGRQLKSVHNRILEGIAFPSLTLTITNTSIEKLPSGLFEHMNEVRNLSLDVRNNYLTTIQNPSATGYPGLPSRTFLMRLLVSTNDWMCNCEIGWIEMWQRKKRQIACKESDMYNCYKTEDDLRQALCKKGYSLSDTFKTDLECRQTSSGYISQLLDTKTFIFSLLLLCARMF